MINSIDAEKIPHIMEMAFAPTDNDTVDDIEDILSNLQNRNELLENENRLI